MVQQIINYDLINGERGFNKIYCKFMIFKNYLDYEQKDIFLGGNVVFKLRRKMMFYDEILNCLIDCFLWLVFFRFDSSFVIY